MQQEAGRATDYVLGDSERELVRLERQASIFADVTRDVLVRAGLAPGMRVLDIGCGVGDVSLIAADLVGPTGSVIAVDKSPAALAIAGQRAAARGATHVSFEPGELDRYEPAGTVDAVIGRFILLHIPEPAAVLRRLVGMTAPGTRFAFIEMDLSTVTTRPDLPLTLRHVGHIAEVYRRAGLEPDMGSRLHRTFRDAGLDPRLNGYTHIGTRDDDIGIDFLTESIRSLLPVLEALGIASAEEIGIDTLRARLVAETEALDPCIFYPRIVGAWARR